MSEDGRIWTTCWSGFDYTILNPNDEENGAVVEYEGACRAFLAQDLIPDELGAETEWAEVTEGSALQNRFGELKAPCAQTLVHAYGMLQAKVEGQDNRSLEAALMAVEAARIISKQHGDEVRSGFRTHYSSCHTYIEAKVGGEKVEWEICCYAYANEKTAEEVAARVTKWLEKVRPQLTPVKEW